MVNENLHVYRSCTPVVSTTYEREGYQTLSMTIVEAVAEAEGVHPTDLPPMYEIVDSDAVDRLFANYEEGTESEAVLSFTHDHWNIFVRGDGEIRVCDAMQPTDPEPIFESSPA